MNVRTTTDQDLLAAARKDAEAFAEFYDRHEAPLLAFLVRATGSAETAADVAAEVFATLLREIGRGVSVNEPRGWLYVVARRKVVDGVRRGAVDDSVRRALAMQPLVLTDAALERIDELADDDNLRARELVRHAVDGDPHVLVAEHLQVSVSAIKSLINRARLQLRHNVVAQIH